MQRSKTGDWAGLEAIKWLAFALMVLDHLARYAISGLGPLPWLLGRLVFPLFAIALGVGLARRRDLSDVALRLLVWGTVAQGALIFAVGRAPYLNVLFTFAAGVVWAHCLVSPARSRPAGLEALKDGVREGPFGPSHGFGSIAARSAVGLLALLLACASEYGPIGALLVVSAIWFGRRHLDGARHWPSVVALVVAVALLTPINSTAFAMLALPVAWLLLRWPVEVPRVRRLFYSGYVAQWALVGAVAWVLR